MATPVVSGSVAVMLQKDPTLTPDMVKARLMKTASKTFPIVFFSTDPTTGVTYTDVYDPFTRGAGYLDIAATLANTDQITARPSGVKHRNAAGYMVYDPSSIWGTSAM
jgi:serine protease AprX